MEGNGCGRIRSRTAQISGIDNLCSGGIQLRYECVAVPFVCVLIGSYAWGCGEGEVGGVGHAGDGGIVRVGVHRNGVTDVAARATDISGVDEDGVNHQRPAVVIGAALKTDMVLGIQSVAGIYGMMV